MSGINANPWKADFGGILNFFNVWKETMSVGCLQFADVFSTQLGDFFFFKKKKKKALILMPFKAE